AGAAARRPGPAGGRSGGMARGRPSAPAAGASRGAPAAGGAPARTARGVMSGGGEAAGLAVTLPSFSRPGWRTTPEASPGRVVGELLHVGELLQQARGGQPLARLAKPAPDRASSRLGRLLDQSPHPARPPARSSAP